MQKVLYACEDYADFVATAEDKPVPPNTPPTGFRYVFVNGARLEEPYVKDRGAGICDIEFPYQVPEARWFVMGDHRATSVDSRSSALGCVAEEQIVGKIVFRLWPLSRAGNVE